MKKELRKLMIREIKRITRQLKKDSGIVSIIQFGSSLKPREMFSNSDIDFVVITKRKRKQRSIYIKSNFESDFLVYSKNEFKEMQEKGHPIALTAINFGKILYNKDKGFKLEQVEPTELTIKTWMNNGMNVFNSAIMEYFAMGCPCCYLKAVHHSARNLLKALILKNKDILCQTNKEILQNLPRKYQRKYQKLINYRKNLNDFEFDIEKILKIKKIKGKTAKPLLCLESLVHNIIFEMKQKKMYSLREIINKAEEKINYINYDHINLIYFSRDLKQYFINLVLNNQDKKDYKPKMKFLRFPLFK